MGKRSNGEGTIYKRNDGRWCAAYYDTEFRRHYVYGKTQSEVKKKLKEREQVNSSTKPSQITVEEWVREYLEKFKKNELKATTYSTYHVFYRKHIKNSNLGKMKLDKVTGGIVQKYYNDKIEDGYASKTIRHLHTLINGAFTKGVQLHMIKENPVKYVNMPKKEKYQAEIISKKDVEKIVKEAVDDVLYPIVVTTMYTGMRKGEVFGLTWENVDFQNRTIFVRQSLCKYQKEPDENGVRKTEYRVMEPKNKTSVRAIPMIDPVYEALVIQKKRQDQDKERYQEIYRDEGFVFADPDGGYFKQSTFMTKYHRFLKTYGVKDIRFHDLRHTFASLLLEAGVSMKVVQELLGHSTITTTMDIYAHISDEMKTGAINKLVE